jgi:hypothetical protein
MLRQTGGIATLKAKSLQRLTEIRENKILKEATRSPYDWEKPIEERKRLALEKYATGMWKPTELAHHFKVPVEDVKTWLWGDCLYYDEHGRKKWA